MLYKSVVELLAILKERGLELRDRETAKHYLSTVGHHRLTAFYEHFYANPKSFDSSIPTTIDDVVHLYSFDRRLRLLLIGPLEKIEVALRALIIVEVGDYLQQLGDGNAEIQLFDPRLYNLSTRQNQRNYQLAKEACERGVWSTWIGPFSRSKDGKYLSKPEREKEFTKHYANMDAWAVLQTASFGPLTHIYSILKSDIANSISQRFNLPRVVLTTTLFALKELRNSCAHHEPIWNWDARRRSVQLLFPKAFAGPAAVTSENEYRLYAYCAIIHILLSFLSHGNSTWYRRLKKLVNEYNTMYSASMGFPEDWQAMPFWCVPDVGHARGYAALRSRVISKVPQQPKKEPP